MLPPLFLASLTKTTSLCTQYDFRFLPIWVHTTTTKLHQNTRFLISFMLISKLSGSKHKHVPNMVCSAALLIWTFYHTQYALERDVGEPQCIAMHFGGYVYKVFSEGADRSSSALQTRLVSRAEVAADPPALQLPLALTQRARGRAAIVAACGC